MKRLPALLLAILLLTGCAASGMDPATEPTQPEKVIKELYHPGSELETQSGGAVRIYGLEERKAVGMKRIPGGVAVLWNDNGMGVTLMQGETGAIAAETMLGCTLESAKELVPGNPGMGFFHEEEGCVVLLNGELEENGRFYLPEERVGKAILTADWSRVYYCRPEGIFVLDLQSGISRLLREQDGQSQELLEMIYDGRILLCSMTGADGRVEYRFISAESGETLALESGRPAVSTLGDGCFLDRWDGTTRELLFSPDGSETKELYPLEPYGEVSELLEGCGIIAQSVEEDGVTLNYYDLRSGLRRAEVRLGEVTRAWGFVGDPDSDAVWFFADGRNGTVLCRWNLKDCLTGDRSSYWGIEYTAQAPDLEGIELCKQTARELGERFGVEILLWDDAVIAPEYYHIEGEYQIPAIQMGLEKLEKAMLSFPEGFFTAAAQGTASGTIRIELVRGLTAEPGYGSVEAASGLQFWQDGDAYIVVTVRESMEQSVYHEMSHVIDNRVIGVTKAYDDWEQWNPWDFEYDYSYQTNQTRQGAEYLMDSDRAFIDTFSMSFPAEDRARILEYAMLPGAEGYFQTQTMQNKLHQICTGIRRAFDLREYPEMLLWEQYLWEPIV